MNRLRLKFALAIGMVFAMAVAAAQSGMFATDEVAPAEPETGVAVAPIPERMVHLRIYDAHDDSLLVSSWPDEDGELRLAHSAYEDPVGPLPELEEWPPLLRPFLSDVAQARIGDTLTVAGVQLPDAQTREIELARSMSLATEGVVTRAEGERLFGTVLTGAVVRFADAVPVRILHATADEVAYQIILEGPASLEVREVPELHLDAVPDGDRIVFTLNTSADRFLVTGGCVVGTNDIKPGYYLVEGEDEDRILLRMYDNLEDYLLEGQFVTLEVTLVEAEQPDSTETNEGE